MGNVGISDRLYGWKNLDSITADARKSRIKMFLDVVNLCVPLLKDGQHLLLFVRALDSDFGRVLQRFRRELLF